MVTKKIKGNQDIYISNSQRLTDKLGLDDIPKNSDIKPSNNMKNKNKNCKYYYQTIYRYFIHKKVEDTGRINNNNRYQDEEKIIKYMSTPTRIDFLNVDYINDEKNLIKKK